MKPSKLEVLVANQEELIRRLMDILIHYAGHEERFHIARLWSDYLDVRNGIEDEYKTKMADA